MLSDQIRCSIRCREPVLERIASVVARPEASNVDCAVRGVLQKLGDCSLDVLKEVIVRNPCNPAIPLLRSGARTETDELSNVVGGGQACQCCVLGQYLDIDKPNLC